MLTSELGQYNEIFLKTQRLSAIAQVEIVNNKNFGHASMIHMVQQDKEKMSNRYYIKDKKRKQKHE